MARLWARSRSSSVADSHSALIGLGFQSGTLKRVRFLRRARPSDALAEASGSGVSAGRQVAPVVSWPFTEVIVGEIESCSESAD